MEQTENFELRCVKITVPELDVSKYLEPGEIDITGIKQDEVYQTLSLQDIKNTCPAFEKFCGSKFFLFE